MHSTKAVLLAVIVAGGCLIAGCQDGGKLKTEADQALAKLTEMKNYKFSGKADVDLGAAPASKDANPIAASLSGIALNSKTDWSGVASTDPVRLELDLKSTPVGSAAALELPILLKDNKLFFRLPMINAQDEYFTVDLAQLSAVSGQTNALSPEGLKSATSITSDFLKSVLGEIDGKWFKKTDDAKLADGSSGKVVKVEITGKNKQAITDAMRKKLPELIDKLQKGGLLSADQADKLKQGGVKTIEVQAPGFLQLTIDGGGFVREEQIELPFTTTGADGKAANHHMNLHQSYDEINKSAAFQKELPKQTKSFDAVLQLLAGKK